MRSLQTMGEAPRRQTTPRRTLLHAAARHDPFEQRTVVYHEDVAESLDLGDSVRHEVDAIEIGDRLALVDVSAIVPERLRCAGAYETPSKIASGQIAASPSSRRKATKCRRRAKPRRRGNVSNWRNADLCTDPNRSFGRYSDRGSYGDGCPYRAAACLYFPTGMIARAGEVTRSRRTPRPMRRAGRRRRTGK
jgi:hypothetical protein